ncbi:MAG TPA: hypothetical protein PLP05_04635 [Sedimentisphaerales bacterium]|nr:hypothetical protein [Sedimentisphaerales bacterium]
MHYDHKNRKAFSLAETIAALTIGSMVMVSVLTVYTRLSKASNSIISNMDRSSAASEVLQAIAEDIDRLTVVDDKVKLTFENKTIEGFQVAQLTISRPFYNRENQEDDFEKIIWRCGFDYNSDANGLVLYRSHSGIVSEDRLLHGQKERSERELFIPFCEGVTYFSIHAVEGETLIDDWKNENKLPVGAAVTISFAQPFKTVSGLWDVYEEDMVSRVIAVNRTRKIPFYAKDIIKQNKQDNNDVEDVNNVNDANLTDGDPNDLQLP